jgi:hypothetical protein
MKPPRLSSLGPRVPAAAQRLERRPKIADAYAITSLLLRLKLSRLKKRTTTLSFYKLWQSQAVVTP